MQVLLLEDIYKLGHAGQVKKVANGYGRNFLIPQGLATRATKGALQQAERIAADADKKRTALNAEMSAVAEKFVGLQLFFPARAGETGKLYGSVTTQMLADQIGEKIGLKIDKRQIHGQPLRLLGMHKIGVRLTMDIIPQFEVIVYREGESPENYMVAAEQLAAAAEAAQQPKAAEAAKPETAPEAAEEQQPEGRK
ncbi:MAG: 50S ribosomal protein L9 [Chloroflexi bacterium]|nr:50S ribosomal protein L9 [Chloroflexota bacterium]